MGPAADFAALGTQAECILQRGEQAQAADRPRAWEGPAGQARDDQEEGGRARGAEADQGVWMTARSACSRGPRVPSMYTHSAFDLQREYTRENTVHAFVYYRTSTCSIYPISRDRRVLLPPVFHISYHSSHPITSRSSSCPQKYVICAVIRAHTTPLDHDDIRDRAVCVRVSLKQSRSYEYPLVRGPSCLS